jgi:putative glutamine amidotransferase
MSPAQPDRLPQSLGQSGSAPRIGVPYRTLNEQLTNKRESYDKYLEAIRLAGGEAVEIPLNLSKNELGQLIESLDAYVLSGGPADVDPQLYRAARDEKSAPADAAREQTDFAILGHAFAEHKPVLGICYGVQSMNVFLGGSLIQDIASEYKTTIQHQWRDRTSGTPEPFHPARIEPNSRLSELSGGATETEINSSHHQALLEPAKGLRVTAHAPDGIIEAVEWTGSANWITGVQWHPERMPDHALSSALFRELAAVAKAAQVRG